MLQFSPKSRPFLGIRKKKQKFDVKSKQLSETEACLVKAFDVVLVNMQI